MKKEKGLQLSKKHGANPAIDVCFWCGAEKGIILLGKLKDDAEAPKYLITDYEPCEKCRETFEQGMFIFEATTYPQSPGCPPAMHCDDPNQPPAYPTGRFIVVPVELLKDPSSISLRYATSTESFEAITADLKKKFGEDKVKEYVQNSNEHQKAVSSTDLN